MKQTFMRIDGDLVTVFTESWTVKHHFEKAGYKPIREKNGWLCTIDVSLLRKMKGEKTE